MENEKPSEAIGAEVPTISEAAKVPSEGMPTRCEGVALAPLGPEKLEKLNRGILIRLFLFGLVVGWTIALWLYGLSLRNFNRRLAEVTTSIERTRRVQDEIEEKLQNTETLCRFMSLEGAEK